MDESPSPATRPSVLDWVFRVLGFVLLVAVCFALPNFPSAELDDSWRMAVGKFFAEGRQFGTEVVFTYGPLGWTMGRTYWGGQWHAQIGWQLFQSVLMATLVYWHAFRLRGYRRVFFLAFFFLFGLSYQDAVQQVAMFLAGLELIRRSHQPWRWSSLLLVALLAVYSLVKFNNLLLGLALAGLAGALEFWESRRWPALRVPALFGLLFFVGWVACGQHLGNLPAYLHSSWEISQGYQDTMGLPCPRPQLVVGILTALLLLAYLAVNWLSATQRIRSLALTLAALAYLYLNWKHGYIRADGHQIGFYYAAMTVALGAPLLLEDPERWRLGKAWLQAATGLTALVGIELVLPGLARGALSMMQGRADLNAHFVLGIGYGRDVYDGRLEAQANATALKRTQREVKDSSLDVLGFEQGVALFNHFNYTPRPVFQSYSVYTPYLARLNYDFYASDRAPEWILFKLQAIDGRLAMMDDSDVLRLIVHRYTYQFSEGGFTVWKRKPGPFHAEAYAPRPLRTLSAKLGEKIDLSNLQGKIVWAEIDYRFSLLGKLRRLLFRPVLVQLRVVDQKGVESVYRLPQPIGRTGFVLSPIINDMMEYMRNAGGDPTRKVASVTIETAASDRDCVQDDVTLTLSELPGSDAGKDYFKAADKAKFYMFVDAPMSYEALNPPGEDIIDGRKVMIMHAPSHMDFEIPAGASEIRGEFGFVAGAYSNGGKTNGAEFVITYSDGNDPVVLMERYLDPVPKLADRGLQKFSVHLPKGTGRVRLEIKPGLYGEYAFDWTGWTGIEFK